MELMLLLPLLPGWNMIPSYMLVEKRARTRLAKGEGGGAVMGGGGGGCVHACVCAFLQSALFPLWVREGVLAGRSLEDNRSLAHFIICLERLHAKSLDGYIPPLLLSFAPTHLTPSVSNAPPPNGHLPMRVRNTVLISLYFAFQVYGYLNLMWRMRVIIDDQLLLSALLLSLTISTALSGTLHEILFFSSTRALFLYRILTLWGKHAWNWVYNLLHWNHSAHVYSQVECESLFLVVPYRWPRPRRICWSGLLQTYCCRPDTHRVPS